MVLLLQATVDVRWPEPATISFSNTALTARRWSHYTVPCMHGRQVMGVLRLRQIRTELSLPARDGGEVRLVRGLRLQGRSWIDDLDFKCPSFAARSRSTNTPLYATRIGQQFLSHLRQMLPAI